MTTLLDLEKFSRTEKLRAMEEIWTDLSRSDDADISPDWHRDVLRERENALKTGQDAFMPWEEAKKILRDQ